MENEIEKVSIMVDQIEEQNGKVSLKSVEGQFYSFFIQKKDGTESKACTQFNEKQISQGDTVHIAYKLNGKYKNIVWFEDEAEEAAPKQDNSEEMREIRNELQDIREQMRLLRNDYSGLYTYVSMMPDFKPEALKFHQGFEASPKTTGNVQPPFIAEVEDEKPPVSIEDAIK